MNRKEREAEYRREEDRIWGEFEKQLAAFTTVDQVRALVKKTPRPSAPGLRFYSSLRALFFVLRDLPEHVTFAERVAYYWLLQRPAIRAHFSPEEYARIMKQLTEYLEGRGIID